LPDAIQWRKEPTTRVKERIRRDKGLARESIKEDTMLVLSRKVGERVVIGDRIVVTVLEVKGRQVRLGFEAPPDVQIWRGELAFDDHVRGAADDRKADEAHLITTR
jgi:carbon storage regulator CsrA